MKALITGSEGFIGRNLSRELKDNGYDVVCCDIVPGADSQALDIMDKQAVKDIISTSSPDVIINLAGLVGIGLSWKDPQRTVELNTIGTINILEAIRESGIKTKLVVVGSAGFTITAKMLRRICLLSLKTLIRYQNICRRCSAKYT